MITENSIGDIVSAQELIELCARMTKNLNSFAVPTALDCRGLYCHKTGQLVGMRSQQTLLDALKLHGADFVEKTLFYANGGNCHPLWLKTDPETLDRLMTIDARGYAVYCMRLLTAQFYKPPKIAKRDIMSASVRQTFACARAFQILGHMSDIQISKLNDALRNCLTYGDHAARLVFRKLNSKLDSFTPDELALFAKNGILTVAINNSIKLMLDSVAREAQQIERVWAQDDYGNYSWVRIHRKKFEERPRTPSDAAKGPSQIRGQKSARDSVKYAELMAMYGRLWSDKDNPPPGQETWRKKFNIPFEQDTEIPPEFMGMSLVDLENVEPSNMGNPDRVEMRTISRTLLPERAIPIRERLAKLIQKPAVQAATVPEKPAPIASKSALLSRMLTKKG